MKTLKKILLYVVIIIGVIYLIQTLLIAYLSKDDIIKKAQLTNKKKYYYWKLDSDTSAYEGLFIEDLKYKEKRIQELEAEKEQVKENLESEINDIGSWNSRLSSQIRVLKHLIVVIVTLVLSLSLSFLLWFNKFQVYNSLLEKFTHPIFFNLSIQVLILSTAISFIFPKHKKLLIISSTLIALITIIISLA